MPKLNAITAPFRATIHGIDPYAPGGFEQLLAHHRKTFGYAVMEAGAGDGGNGGGDGGNGDGGQGTGNGSQAGDGQDGGEQQLGDAGKKALQTERDARKAAEKLAADREARIKELEDATKSDEDKRNERFDALEKSDREKEVTISSQAATILRYQIAAAKGLDLEAAERLRGNTKEEIEADADEFAKKFGSKRVGEVPGAGNRGSDTGTVAPGQSRIAAAYAASSK